MEHDKTCDPPEKASNSGDSVQPQDKNWDKWIAKCNELNKLCKLNKTESKVGDSDDKPKEGDGESKEGSSADISKSGDGEGSDKLHDDSETNNINHNADEDGGAGTLRRMTTAPELFEKTQCHDKVLKKRNTLPANLTKTLLMVGRLHDVAETAIEEKLKYLDINGEKPIDKNEQETESSDQDSTIPPETSDKTSNDTNTLTEDSVSSNEEENKNLKEREVNNVNKESNNATVQENEDTKGQKDNGSNSGVSQAEQVSGPDETDKADTIKPEKIVRQPTAADIKIQLNDNSVESTTALQEEQDAANAGAAKTGQCELTPDGIHAEADLGESTNQPCVINVCSCSTVTMEPDSEPGLPVDENLLFVGDPDTSSLNGFDLAADPEPKLRTQANERYCRKTRNILFSLRFTYGAFS